MKRDLPYIVLLLVLGGVLFWVLRRHDPTADLLRDAAAKIREQTAIIHRLDSTYVRLTKEQRKIDTVHVRQQAAYARTDSTYKAAPTKIVHDTVWVPKAQADADIAGCQVLLLTCNERAAVAEARASNRDSTATAAEQQRDQYKVVADGVTTRARKERWQWGIDGVVGGFASCTLLSLLHR